MLMRGFQLGKDRGQGRIDFQLGGAQFLMEGALLFTQGLPLSFVGATFALALEGFELLLEAVMFRFEGRIGGESSFAGCMQLGFFVGGQDGIMMMMPASRASRSRG